MAVSVETAVSATDAKINVIFSALVMPSILLNLCKIKRSIKELHIFRLSNKQEPFVDRHIIIIDVKDNVSWQ